MTVYMPPIARKKKVDEKYNPDSFRVISTDAEETHPKFSPRSYRASFEPPTPDERLFPDIYCGRTRVLPKPTADFRANNPHPKSCSFIRTDVRLLNEPVCTVHTRETHPQQEQWWPARANKGTLEKGDHTLDTIYRNDFLYTNNLAPPPTFRHSANPNTTPARGIAPVNFMKEKDGQQGFYKEGLSYEHQYNSRADPNYPIRGKRHGAFVYSKMSPEARQKLIEAQSKQGQEPQAVPAQSVSAQYVPAQAVPAQSVSAQYVPAQSVPAQSVSAQSVSAQSVCPQVAVCPRAVSPEAVSPQIASSPPSKPAAYTREAPLSSPRAQTRSAAGKVPSPEMMPTMSSPIEWYDPETDTLKPKAAVRKPRE